jgi:hypothetical protein
MRRFVCELLESQTDFDYFVRLNVQALKRKFLFLLFCSIRLDDYDVLYLSINEKKYCHNIKAAIKCIIIAFIFKLISV